MTDPAYNWFASAEADFSPPLFNFLVKQISTAVLTAVRSAQGDTQVILYESSLPAGPDQLAINRSPNVFLLNWDRDHVLNKLGDPGAGCQQGPGEADHGWQLPDCPRLRAVDRRLTLLELRRQDTRIGLLVFFAVHPTVLAAASPIYDSDFVGAAMDTLEREWATTIVGFFNGAEGDITARRVTRDVTEVNTWGREFASAITRALKQPERRITLEPRIQVRAKIIDTRKKRDRTCTLPSGPPVTIAAFPEIGVPARGGAELDRTEYYALGYREGVRAKQTDDQGTKLSLFNYKSRETGPGRRRSSRCMHCP